MTTKNHAGEDAPRPSSTTPVKRPGGVTGKVHLRAGSADAVLAIVPHMLGFYPSLSLVVLGLGERNLVKVTFRYDLPDPTDCDGATDIADHARYVLEREQINSVMLIGYGPTELVAPALACTVHQLAEAGIELHEALQADGGRYWSLLCRDPSCCPAEGVPYDPGSHPAAAAMTAAGINAYPDREALVRTLQQPPGTSDLTRRATSIATQRLMGFVARCMTNGDVDAQLQLARLGRAEVQRAIRLYRRGGSIVSPYRLAWLAVLLTDLRVRDDAWARMDPAHNEAHRRLWTDVVKGASTECVPAPAALLAFVAWQAGNGALAAVAVDRALSANPDYSMATLLAGALEAGLPPSAARMPMTPAQVAASYASVPAGKKVPERVRTTSGRPTPRGGNWSQSNRGQSQSNRGQSQSSRSQPNHGRAARSRGRAGRSRVG